MSGEFGRKLRAFREFSGLSQEAVAQKLGVSFTTVNRWENGHSMPNPLARKSVEQLWREYGFEVPPSNGEQQLRVLIVDDEEDIIMLLRRALKGVNVPLKIDSATDGYEAGYKFKSFLPHLVLLDVFLPGIRGDKICARIKQDESTENTTVIAITGYLNPALEKSLKEAGADAIFSKPFNVDEIRRIVKEQFRKWFADSESV